MPNPYDPDEIKRQAQISALGAPVNSTMPVRDTPSGLGAPPAGFDAKNWADPNMHSVKYDAGRMLAGKNKPTEVGAIVGGADFQKRFPGATFDGKDKIDFRGAMSDGQSGVPVGIIDVLMQADADADTSQGLWWGHEPDGGSVGAGPVTTTKTLTNGRTVPTESMAGDNSSLARIMAELTAASNGEPSPAEREALLQILQGEMI